MDLPRRRVPNRQATNSDGVFGYARWSPDGKKLAVIGHQREYRGGTLSRLWLFPLPASRAKTCVTAHWDRSIGGTVNSDVRPGMAGSGLTWSPDGKAVYFVADNRGATQLYRVDVEAGTDTEPVAVVGGPPGDLRLQLECGREKAALAVSEHTNPATFTSSTCPRSTARTGPRLPSEVRSRMRTMRCCVTSNSLKFGDRV